MLKSVENFSFSMSVSSPHQEVYLGQFNASMVPYLPQELIHLLTWISPDPMAWFVGQFVKYLLRPRTWFQEELNQLMQSHPGEDS